MTLLGKYVETSGQEREGLVNSRKRKQSQCKRRRRMSMKPQGLEPIPEETERLAKRACPKGTLAMQLRDALGLIYQDAVFADLFAKRGRGALSPASLALVTVLQAMEGLTE
jgi:hypothetical protein